MSDLEQKIDARISLNGKGAEYEKAFIACKKFSKVMNKAILGQASKEEIQGSIVIMQSSLEIVKQMNGTKTSVVNDEVLKSFGVGEKEPTVKKSSKK